MENRDYIGSVVDPSINPEVGVSLVSDDPDTRLLRVTVRLSDRIQWTVYRSAYEVWKLHVYFSLRHVGEIFTRTDGGNVPKLSWFHMTDKSFLSLTDSDCEDIRNFLIWILDNPTARSSDKFCQFVEVSALSFHCGEKSIVEGYADKRRGGRRFVMQGCSGTLSGGVASMFRKKFQKRWFVLRRDYIVYTDSRTSSTVRDVFLFDKYFQVQLVSEKEGGRGTIKPGFLRSSKIESSPFLEIKNGYRKLILRFDSHVEANHWLKTIQDAYSRSEWINATPNRFESFAPVRDRCSVKLLVDGENYMRELDTVLRSAKHEIYISGWWLVPQLPLVRISNSSVDHSLLSILTDRAQNHNVKIFIVLYKELSVALSLDSRTTKSTLESISPNIRVIRHPKQIGVNAVLAWSHHQKLVLIDQRIAFVGGLDLCLGRYDNAAHRLADLGSPYVFPGKDYCNPCLRDMLDVSDPFIESGKGDLYDRTCEPRLPWHDVHCVVRGPVVNDIVRHFVQLWNHVKTDKHRRQSGVEFLVQSSRQASMVVDDADTGMFERIKSKFVRTGSSEKRSMTIVFDDKEIVAGSLGVPDTLGMGVGATITVDDEDSTNEKPLSWKEKLFSMFKRPGGETVDKDDEDNEEDVPLPERGEERMSPPSSPSSSSMMGATVQFLRSGTWWSMGLPTEHSILNAYCDLISKAEKFIYIENQFFVTSAKFTIDEDDAHRTSLSRGQVRNLIGRFIAERIVRSETNGENLKVYIVLPMMPAFENSQLMDPSGFVTRATLQLQFESLTRGDDSILGYIKHAWPESNQGEEIFLKHVCVCGLRQTDVWPNGTVRSEQLYVHSKAMVVDDKFAIIGSANINDRSMLGERDSEIAVLIEDERFAHEMRMDLWKEHSSVDNESILGNPQSEECFAFWKEISRNNSQIHKAVFGAIPSDQIRNRQQFMEHMKNMDGLSSLTEADIVRYRELRNLKGRLVEFQLGFLQDEGDLYNPMPTTASLCPREVFS